MYVSIMYSVVFRGEVGEHCTFHRIRCLSDFVDFGGIGDGKKKQDTFLIFREEGRGTLLRFFFAIV